MNASTRQAPSPWYRHAWPWLLMLPPAASVVVGTVLAYFALHVPLPLSVADYADIEATTAREFSADAAATALGLGARVVLRAGIDGAARIDVEITSRADMPLADDPRLDDLVLSFEHPADPARDRRVPLHRDGLHYTGRVELAAAAYSLELAPEARAWRLAGALDWRPSERDRETELTSQRPGAGTP